MAASGDRRVTDAQQLPRGRHGLPRAFVIKNQRDRIFASLACVCSAKGYANVTVQDITDDAGVSRRTFYDLFADKEQCFLAAYDLVVERLWREVEAAYSSGELPWTGRISAALRAIVRLYIAEPDFARLITVEVLGAGHAALARRDAALRRFAVFFEPAAAQLPDAIAEREVLVQAVIGGLYEILYIYSIEGRTERLPAILPELVYCVVVPYLGPAAALEARDAARAKLDTRGVPAASQTGWGRRYVPPRPESSS
jgi:AcrR family transcriptional regulator